MKKNFLKIAALLIAAMLLVVSCSQEIAPKNDNLVNASVNIADTRSLLSTTGEALESGDVTYQYKLTNKFTKVEGNSEIVGIMNDYETIPEDKKLGFVTQGLWTIEVRGIRNVEDENTVVLYGKADHYFNNQNEVAKVFVNPTAGKGTVSISIQMQDLDKATGTRYKVKYALTAIDDRDEAPSYDLTRAQNSTGETSTYFTASSVEVDAGYYRLTISVWGPNPNGGNAVQIGGVTKSIRVLNGSTVAVTGSVEPSNFDKSDVKVMLIEPTGSITTNSSLVTNTNITITATDSTNVTDLTNAGYTRKTNGIIEVTDGNAFAVSYIWDVNGSKHESTENTCTVNFADPGPKSVSCAIVYRVKSFAETYTYVSALNQQLLTLNFIVNEATSSST